jgi:serine protease Do
MRVAHGGSLNLEILTDGIPADMKFRATRILPTLACCLCVQAQEFLDDAALEIGFEQGMSAHAQAGKGLTIADAKAGISKTAGRKVSISPAPESKPGPVYQNSAPAVVAVGVVYQCKECDKWHQGGFASGWILSPEGLVVTNAHVFEGERADVPGVMTRDGAVFPVKEIVASNPDADIAVFRIDPGERKLAFLKMADSVSVGDEVFVLSHPQGRLWTLTNGRVSRFHRQRDDKNSKTSWWMAVTADFAGGSSGGPVLNARGEVVGMASSTLTAYSDSSTCKDRPDPDVQMIFKDCVPLKALREMVEK